MLSITQPCTKISSSPSFAELGVLIYRYFTKKRHLLHVEFEACSRDALAKSNLAKTAVIGSPTGRTRMRDGIYEDEWKKRSFDYTSSFESILNQY